MAILCAANPFSFLNVSRCSLVIGGQVRTRLKHERLAEAIARSRRSQNGWAIHLELSPAYLSRLANGKRPYPNPETREKLLAAFEMKFEELFEIEYRAKSDPPLYAEVHDSVWQIDSRSQQTGARNWGQCSRLQRSRPRLLSTASLPRRRTLGRTLEPPWHRTDCPFAVAIQDLRGNRYFPPDGSLCAAKLSAVDGGRATPSFGRGSDSRSTPNAQPCSTVGSLLIRR